MFNFINVLHFFADEIFKKYVITADLLIEQLQLVPHPEGGYYKETYRAGDTLPDRKNEKRNISTAIYFLLMDTNRSRFHRIQSDELWFFHIGEPVEIHVIQKNTLHTIVLGNDLLKGHVLQATVPANCWFASSVQNEKGFSLVSCTVAPGFDFADFELAERNTLTHEFPHLKNIIEQFT